MIIEPENLSRSPFQDRTETWTTDGWPVTMLDAIKYGQEEHRKWLREFLVPPDNAKVPGFCKPINLSIYDIDDCGRTTIILDKELYGWKSRDLDFDSLTNWKGGDRMLRVFYFSLPQEPVQDPIDTDILNQFAVRLGLNERFFYAQFLPSLPSDKDYAFHTKRIPDFVPLLPSENKFFALKTPDGSNITASFCTQAYKVTVDNRFELIEPYIVVIGGTRNLGNGSIHGDIAGKHSFYHLSRNNPITVYNGSEFMYPLTQLVVNKFSQYLHGLTRQNLSPAQFQEMQINLSVVQDRLDFNIQTLKRLGPPNCPETGKILSDLEHLRNNAISFGDAIVKRQQQHQAALQTDVAEQNLTAAKNSVILATKATDLADKQLVSADSVLNLTILAAVFLPFNTVAVIVPICFSKERTPIWVYFIVSVVLEVIIFAWWIVSRRARSKKSAKRDVELQKVD